MTWQSETRAWVLAAAGTLFLVSGGLFFLQARENTNELTTEITRPCRGPKGPDACGVFGQVKKTVIEVGDITVTTQKQVAQTDTLIKQSVDLFAGARSDIHTVATALAGTASSASTMLQTSAGSLTSASQSLQRVADAAVPLENRATAFVGHLDVETAPLITHADLVLVNGAAIEQSANSFMNRPSWGIIADRSADILTTGSHMLETGDKVETKLAKCTLTPTFGCVFKTDALFGAQLTGYILR